MAGSSSWASYFHPSYAVAGGSDFPSYFCPNCSLEFRNSRYATTSAAAAPAPNAPIPCPECSYRYLIPYSPIIPPLRVPPPPPPPPPSHPSSSYVSTSSVTYDDDDTSDSSTDSEDYESDFSPAATESFVAKLPVKIFPPESTLPLPTCSICLEDFKLNPEASGAANELPCGHLFHEVCISEWLLGSHTCPLCRCRMPYH